MVALLVQAVALLLQVVALLVQVVALLFLTGHIESLFSCKIRQFLECSKFTSIMPSAHISRSTQTWRRIKLPMCKRNGLYKTM